MRVTVCIYSLLRSSLNLSKYIFINPLDYFWILFKILRRKSSLLCKDSWKKNGVLKAKAFFFTLVTVFYFHCYFLTLWLRNLFFSKYLSVAYCARPEDVHPHVHMHTDTRVRVHMVGQRALNFKLIFSLASCCVESFEFMILLYWL